MDGEGRLMRYLVLAAGMGKRLGPSGMGKPKCLIPLSGETLIGRLIRQIRACDEEARISIVAGYRSEEVIEAAPGCSVILNPFFDITGINASIWFARSCFDDHILMINGDIAFSEETAQALISPSSSDSFICYDSSNLDPKELNVRVHDGQVVRFGVNFAGYSGAYGGVMRFTKEDGALFARLLHERVARGFNDSRTYYFAFIRKMIDVHHVFFRPFDLAPFKWAEIDYAHDLSRARGLFE
jgi:choline kinase